MKKYNIKKLLNENIQRHAIAKIAPAFSKVVISSCTMLIIFSDFANNHIPVKIKVNTPTIFLI